MMNTISAYIDFVRKYLVIFILLWLFVISLIGKPKVVIRMLYQLSNIEEPLPKIKIIYLIIICSSTISIIMYYQYFKFTQKHYILARRENIEKAYNFYLNCIHFAFISLLLIIIYCFCEKHVQFKALKQEIKKKQLNEKRHHKVD